MGLLYIIYYKITRFYNDFIEKGRNFNVLHKNNFSILYIITLSTFFSSYLNLINCYFCLRQSLEPFVDFYLIFIQIYNNARVSANTNERLTIKSQPQK